MSYEEAYEAGMQEYCIKLDRLNAQRYEKLKAALQQRRMFCVLVESESFDSAVDALPEPNENSVGSR